MAKLSNDTMWNWKIDWVVVLLKFQCPSWCSMVSKIFRLIQSNKIYFFWNHQKLRKKIFWRKSLNYVMIQKLSEKWAIFNTILLRYSFVGKSKQHWKFCQDQTCSDDLPVKKKWWIIAAQLADFIYFCFQEGKLKKKRKVDAHKHVCCRIIFFADSDFDHK